MCNTALKFLGTVMLFITLVLMLNTTGFCYKRSRWLSDKALIDFAVDHELTWRMRNKGYGSRAEFYSKNPKCCSVERFSTSKMLPDFVFTLFGFRNAHVELFYRQPDASPPYPPHDEPYYDANVGVRPCGEIGEWWGIGAQEYERPRDAKTWSE